MADEVSFIITCEWFTEPPNCKPCSACGETMVTNTNRLYMFNEFTLMSALDIEICNSCMEIINDAKTN